MSSRVSMAALVVLASVPMAAGGDWPQFRYDSRRSAASPHSLPKELHLHWTRDFLRPKPAFPDEVRLRYDASYEPIVLGKTLFVPSMVTHSVTAVDTDTGAVRWRFFADGPVWFAPVAWQERVCFVSDDGYLYCLSAKTGRLIWKFRGLPRGRRDRLVFGDRRLVSLWPARGGPVLNEGVIYFGAGLWLGDGTFVHALHAKTGKPIWSNTESNIVAKANLDHGSQGTGGVSPQGYLAVLGEKLIVPSGMQLPAFFNCKTGEAEPYTAGWGGRPLVPKGSWFVAGSGRYMVATGDLYDISRTNDERIPNPGFGRRDHKGLFYPGRYTRVMLDPGHRMNKKEIRSFRQPVLTDDTITFSGGEAGIESFDLSKAKLVKRTEFKRYSLGDNWKAVFRKRWSLKSKLTLHIRAGERFYVGGKNTVAAIDPPKPGKSATITWRAAIRGTPSRILAADGKLFVVTSEGRLYAFGRDRIKKPRLYKRPNQNPAPGNEAHRAAAARILKTSNARDGYAVIFGLGDGGMARGLIRQSNLKLIGIDRDAKRVEKLRKHFHQLGLYGTRITLRAGDAPSVQLPPYMAKLLIVGDTPSQPLPTSRREWERFLRPLRPYGGAAFLSLNRKRQDAVAKKLAAFKLPGMTIRTGSEGVIITRRGALADTAVWTHTGGDAENTGASQDRSLKPPLGILWWDGSMRWFGWGAISAIRVVEGRVFVLRWRLTAYDAYTGQRLWDRWGPKGWKPAAEFVATRDFLYVPNNRTCMVFNAVTGKRGLDITIPKSIAGKTAAAWGYSGVVGEKLISVIGPFLVCMNRKSGRLIWSVRAQHEQLTLSVAVGGNRVFLAEIKQPNRKPKPGYRESKPRTRAFDLSTGKQLWSVGSASEVRYSPKHKFLVTTHGVYRAKDGRQIRKSPPAIYELRSNRYASVGASNFTLAGDTIVHTSDQRLTTYSLLTGRKLINDLRWERRGCTFLRSCPTFATTRFRGNAAYIDLATKRISPLWNIRAGCNNNLVPADGVLSIPGLSSHCACNYMPASMALVPMSILQPEKRSP